MRPFGSRPRNIKSRRRRDYAELQRDTLLRFGAVLKAQYPKGVP